jgi:hypothetical protein
VNLKEGLRLPKKESINQALTTLVMLANCCGSVLVHIGKFPLHAILSTIFAYWEIDFFRQCFQNYRSSAFWTTCFHGTSYVLFWTKKIGWDILWATFSKTHLVSLSAASAVEIGRTCSRLLYNYFSPYLPRHCHSAY